MAGSMAAGISSDTATGKREINQESTARATPTFPERVELAVCEFMLTRRDWLKPIQGLDGIREKAGNKAYTVRQTLSNLAQAGSLIQVRGKYLPPSLCLRGDEAAALDTTSLKQDTPLFRNVVAFQIPSLEALNRHPQLAAHPNFEWAKAEIVRVSAELQKAEIREQVKTNVPSLLVVEANRLAEKIFAAKLLGSASPEEIRGMLATRIRQQSFSLPLSMEDAAELTRQLRQAVPSHQREIRHLFKGLESHGGWPRFDRI
jgi:hypothetical protein